MAFSVAISVLFRCFDAGQHRYPPDTACRYLVTCLIVAAISFAAEVFRQRCFESFREKTRLLEKALRHASQQP